MKSAHPRFREQENVLDRVPFLRSGHMSATKAMPQNPPVRVDEPAAAGVH
jgi:hypothetical protein